MQLSIFFLALPRILTYGNSRVLPALFRFARDSGSLLAFLPSLSPLPTYFFNKSLVDGTRADPHAFRKLSDEEKDAYIRLHPAYGRIVCRCETVSEGEILDALRREPRALDLDGVKRRTRSGMGRCQGGFCSPHILGLLAKELGIPMEQVTKSGSGSNLLTGRL